MAEEVDAQQDVFRKLDVTTSSMDQVALNNLIVSLRPTVKKCRVNIVHKLVHQIRALKKKKGTDEQKESNMKKAERLGHEIEAIKKLAVDRLAKCSLSNTAPFTDMAKQFDPEERVILRVACHKPMLEKVEAWRKKHDDWKSLAAFLMYKNTGRRYKKKKKPIVKCGVMEDSEKTKNPSGNEMKTSEKMPRQLIKTDNKSDKDNSDEDKSSDKSSEDKSDEDKSSDQSSENKSDDDKSDGQKTDESESESETLENPSEQSEISEEEIVLEKTSSKLNQTAGKVKKLQSEKKEKANLPSKLTDNEMVVTKFNLNSIDDNSDDLDFMFKKDESEKDAKSLTIKTVIKKKDSFFLGGGSDSDDSDDDDAQSDAELEDDLNQYQNVPHHSTFRGTLGGQGRGQMHRGQMQRGQMYRGQMHRGQMHRGQNRGQGYDRRTNFSKSTNPNSGQGGLFIKPNKPNEGFKTHPGSKEKSTTSVSSATSTDRGKKRALDATSGKIHPSWEASKRRKEKAQIQTFKGTKITFDDD